MRKRRKTDLDAKALDIGHPLSNNTNDEDPHQKQIQIQIQKRKREAPEVLGPKLLDREVYFTDPKMGWSVDQATIGDQAPESKIVFAPTVDPRVVTCMDGAVTCTPRTLADQVRGTLQVEASLVGQSLATASFRLRVR